MDEVEIVAVDGHVVHGTLYDRNFDNMHAALFVHGITQERTAGGFHASLAEDLSEIGFASLAIDYRGHGASKIQRSDLSLCGIHADVSASLEYMRERLSLGANAKELMIAFSFGGGIGYLVGQEEGVDAILLNAPVLSYAEDIEMAGGADWRYRRGISELAYYGFSLRPDEGAEAAVIDAAINKVAHAVPTVIF
ncbi:MAG: alpha/beta hydrolase, partial [Hyphomicrobiaceae bacterium]